MITDMSEGQRNKTGIITKNTSTLKTQLQEKYAKNNATKVLGSKETYLGSDSHTLDNTDTNMPYNKQNKAPETSGINSDVINWELQARGVVNRLNADWYHKFSRTPIIDPFTTNTTTKEYLFFTKPDLHLFDTTGNINPELANKSTFFVDAIDRYPDVAKQLQYSVEGTKMLFSPLLSNAVNGHLELPGISANTIDGPSNVYGTHISYRGTSSESDEQFDFSLDFKDNKYLEVYMYFKMYDEYERMKWKGEVSPTSIMYIYRKILHDQTSIYKFIVGEDGHTLLYWARLIGCMPLSVPRDTFTELPDGEITFSTNWKAQFVQDMDPIILTDFNRITKLARQGKTFLPYYNTTMKSPEARWAAAPGIYIRKDANTKYDKLNKYYLEWLI